MELRTITILNQFSEAMEKKKKQIALTDSSGEYSWEQINQFSDWMAYELYSQGVEEKSPIGICGRNSAYWVILYLAVLKAGAVPVLINSEYTGKEMEAIQKVVPFSRIFEVNNDDFLQLKAEAARSPLPENAACVLKKLAKGIRPSDLAGFLFTSGTTSVPKAVPLTHYQMINVARQAAAAMHWQENDRVCLSLALFHCFGLSTGLLAALIHGGSIHLAKSYHSADVIATIEQYRCTVLNGVPTMFLAILKNEKRSKADLSSLDSGIIAGSAVYKSDFLTVAQALSMPHLMQSYGQTEASPSVTFSDYDATLEERAESVGKAMEYVQIRIRNSQLPADCPRGEEGEIEIAGYNVMSGYYGNDKANEEAFSNDGWFRTGDIGYLDEAGNLHLTGRKKEIIIRSGENIAPREIEEAILAIGGTTQVKVFGIPAPVVQEDIVACVISEKEICQEYIKTSLKTRLAGYKIPKYIIGFTEFPLNGSGKIDAEMLKQRAVQRIGNHEQRDL